MLHSHRLLWAGHVAWMDMEEGHTRRKHLRGSSRMRWEDNNTWDLNEVDYEGDWKTLAQERVT
mgnify:CR=1 FL=1